MTSRTSPRYSVTWEPDPIAEMRDGYNQTIMEQWAMMPDVPNLLECTFMYDTEELAVEAAQQLHAEGKANVRVNIRYLTPENRRRGIRVVKEGE